MDFPFSSSGYTPGLGWRPLRRLPDPQQGWDVFEWQSRLAMFGYRVKCDGSFGDKTDQVTEKYQKVKYLTVDGIAGLATQVTSGLGVARRASPDAAICRRVYGQMSQECSLLCGVYTAPYSDGSIDRGPVQQNSRYHPDAQAAFDVPTAISVLVGAMKENHARYVSEGVGDQRAWAAAQGHWNNHVNANRYAHGESVPDSFLEYIDAVTAYV